MKKQWPAYAAVMATIFIWSTSYLSTKELSRSFSPLTISLIRFSLGYFTLLIFRKSQGKRQKWSLSAERKYIVLGFTGMFLYYYLENLATKLSYASNVSIIVTSIPLMTVLISSLVFKTERFHWKYLFSFFGVISGFILILLDRGELQGLSILGDSLALIAAMVFASYTIMLRRLETELSTLDLTRRAMGYGLLFNLFFAVIENDWPMVQILARWETVGYFLFLGLLSSAFCFWGWSYGTKSLGPVKASQFIYLVPFITVIFSTLLLSEPFTPQKIIGLLLILTSVFVSQNSLSSSSRFSRGDQNIHLSEGKNQKSVKTDFAD